MKAVEFEDEESLVPKAVSFSFESFDFVIDALELVGPVGEDAPRFHGGEGIRRLVLCPLADHARRVARAGKVPMEIFGLTLIYAQQKMSRFVD